MSTWRIGWLLAASLGLAVPARAQSPAPQAAAFQQRFDAELARHGVIGGGFALVTGPGPAILGFHGEARQDTHQPVDAETAYNWASITKTFTAIAILQLRDRGRLALDDPAVRYVSELREVHDAFGPVEAITIRDLLTHSAGFRNPTWPWDCDDPTNCDWQPFEPTRWTQVAAMLPYTHVAFPPGSRWSYSNLGYVVLGQIIERLSGDDFEVYVDKNILKPLEMHASYFDRAPYFLEGHVSASYLRAGAAGPPQPQPFDFDTGVTTSNSGLKGPITDMVKYLRFLVGDGANPRYETVLRRASLAEMWTGLVPITAPGKAPTAYTVGPHGEAGRMGLGFFVLQSQGRRIVFHDGDQGGFSSELIVDPAGHAAAILAVNTTDTGQPAPNALHAVSNTEPDPATDLRLALRRVLVDTVFPPAAAP
jgi:CubicO group peptidase (beta-lactamase class C family)